MMFDKVVQPGTLRALPGGFSVGVRLPWYRALPLCTVSVNRLTCDGADIAPERITFVLDGQRLPLSKLPELTEQTWFVTDIAMLDVDGTPLEAGSEHVIEAEVEIRPPYVKGLKRVGKVAHRMRAQS